MVLGARTSFRSAHGAVPLSRRKNPIPQAFLRKATDLSIHRMEFALAARDPRMTEKRHRKKRIRGARARAAHPALPVYRGGKGFRPGLDPNSNKSLLDAADSDDESPPSEGVSESKRRHASRRPTHEELSTARTATIHIDPEGAVLSAVQKRFTKAWKTGKYVGEHFGFRSPAALCRAITPGRWELLARLQHIGPTEIPALARALNRDAQRVRDDLVELIRIGLIEKTTQDRVWVPFREIRTNFVLRR